MKVTFYGHSCFKIITEEGKKILIDPWISNPLAPKNIDLGGIL
jgi:Predicted Zn-dependent hydrolases of the beta-lactamase fold